MSTPLDIAYVCRAGSGIGWGHLSRARAVLSANGGGEVMLVEGLDEVGGVAGSLEVGPFDRARVRGFGVVVVDDYDLDLAPADRSGLYVIVDDWMRSEVAADGLVNPNVSAIAGDYADPPSRVLAGAEYALLRPEVEHRCGQWAEGAGPIMVTLGGSDPSGWSARLAERLGDFSLAVGHGPGVLVVLGPGYRGDIPEHGAVQCVRAPGDFLDLCLGAAIVVTSASTTSHELACMGVPFVPLATVDNQLRVRAGWEALGLATGATVFENRWLDAVVDEVDQVLGSERERGRRSERGTELVDGRGGARVIEAFRSWL